MPRWKAWLCRLGMPGTTMAWRSSSGCGSWLRSIEEMRPCSIVSRTFLRHPFEQQRLFSEDRSQAGLRQFSAVRHLRSRLICIYITATAKGRGIRWLKPAKHKRGARASGATPGLRRWRKDLPGLGIVEKGAIVVEGERIAFAGAEADMPRVSGRGRDHRLRRPLDHARPDRLPHPSCLCRQPRQRIRDAAGRRDL